MGALEEHGSSSPPRGRPTHTLFAAELTERVAGIGSQFLPPAQVCRRARADARERSPRGGERRRCVDVVEVRVEQALDGGQVLVPLGELQGGLAPSEIGLPAKPPLPLGVSRPGSA